MDIECPIGSYTIILGDFNTLLPPPDRSLKLKINKETPELNHTTEQMNLAIMYRVFCQTDTEILLRVPRNIPQNKLIFWARNQVSPNTKESKQCYVSYQSTVQ